MLKKKKTKRDQSGGKEAEESSKAQNRRNYSYMVGCGPIDVGLELWQANGREIFSRPVTVLGQ